MPEIELWKVFSSLGIPGLALGVLYLLYKAFDWKLPQVPKIWVGPLMLVFLLIVGGIVFFALHKFGPNDKSGTAGVTEQTPIMDKCLPGTIQFHRKILSNVSNDICSQAKSVKNIVERSPGLVTGVSKMLLWEVSLETNSSSQSIAVCKCYI